ncbi:MAG TPA: GNAT family N-acetyltransferase [Hyphomicrobiaceae bacterium]|nr:GNAT family N-acetyltransferase [Hyphomicrobiaceae bacterium]
MRRTGNAQRHPQFVALDGEHVVGRCEVAPKTGRHRSTVGPSAWGWSVGCRLIGRTLEAARAFPIARVELLVRAGNSRAIALYRKVGFEEEGRRRRALLVNGVYYDDITMALLFDAGP